MSISQSPVSNAGMRTMPLSVAQARAMYPQPTMLGGDLFSRARQAISSPVGITSGVLAGTISNAAQPSYHPPLPPSPPLFKQQQSPPASQPPGFTSVRIVYDNDRHEKFKAQPQQVSGFRFFSEQGRQAGKDVLRLNSGDNNIGKEGHEWELNVRLMNLINYHAVTMGNHELDPGSRNYANGLRHATFPTLLSNLETVSGSALAQKIQEGKIRKEPLIVRDRQGTYGIIGVTTPDLKQVVSSQAKLEGEEVEDWDDTVKIVRKQVQQLQNAGINKIIVLSHMGLDYEKKLARSVPGIDIIVGGHSHDVIHGVTPGLNYLPSPTGEPVLIVQGGKNAQWMGVADVLFDPQGRVIPQQNTLYSPKLFKPDLQATALKDQVLGPPKPLALFNTSFEASGNDFRADAVAQFTADAIRRYANEVDIAFVRSPEIRSNFEPGVFTDHDLKALMPFTDPVVRLKVTGDEILKSLQRSAQGLVKHESHPGMLNGSGIVASLNPKTGEVTQAFTHNKRTNQWEPLNPSKTYTIAIGEFTVKNKEFPEFAHPDRIEWNSGQPVRTFFAWGLQQAGAPQKSISFQDDGRLQIR